MTTALRSPTGEASLYIDGRLVGAASGATFANVNPATDDVLGHVADASVDDALAAVAAARRAFDESGWADDPAFRRRCLEQLRAGFEAEKERLRALIVAESGSPVTLTHGVQLQTPIDDLAYWAETAERYPYERALPDVSAFGVATRRLVRREPVGVAAAITPWNFPFYLNVAKLAPALAAGCTVVLKPAPDTPWSATEIGRIAAEYTDIPPGVLNVVASSDPLVGEALVASPGVDLVTFTGSTATGRRVMATAAAGISRLCLELGGKSAAVVLDDAPFEAAVTAAARAVCVHAGQSCSLATRLLVPRRRYDDAVALAGEVMDRGRPGDPTDPKVLHGPVISPRQRQRILDYVAACRAEHRLVVGADQTPPSDRGQWVNPVLFADVDPDARLAQEEIFGPVLVAIPFEDDDDAVRIANRSVYGLGGTIWSGDDDRALAVARRIRTGTLAINGGLWLAPDTPVGGYRQSGLGREHGQEGFEQFLEVKSIGLRRGTD
jgi:aldehyde dehydrogenase (NAD+)